MHSTGSVNRLLAILVLILSLFPFQASLASSVQSSIYIVPHWKQGQKFHFEMIKTRQKYQDAKSVSQVVTRTDLEIEVLKDGKEGYLIRWAVGETKFDDTKLTETVMEHQLTSLLKGLQFILEIDPEGAIISVQNWKEIQDSYSKMLDTMMTALQKTGKDNDTIEKVREQMNSMFATKEQIESLFTHEAQIFFMPLGQRYRLSKPIKYEDVLINPLDGEPIPSRGQFSLKAVDRRNGQAVVTWQQHVDPKEAARVMEKSVNDIAARMGKPMANGETFGVLIMNDNAEFSIEIASGLINHLTHTRMVKIGQNRQEDTLELIKKPM